MEGKCSYKILMIEMCSMWSWVYLWARLQEKQPWSEVWRVISFRELVWMLLNLAISLQSCHCCCHCGLPEWSHLLYFWEHVYWINCYIFTQKTVCFHVLYLPQSRSGPLPRLDRFPVRHSMFHSTHAHTVYIITGTRRSTLYSGPKRAEP